MRSHFVQTLIFLCDLLYLHLTVVSKYTNYNATSHSGVSGSGALYYQCWFTDNFQLKWHNAIINDQLHLCFACYDKSKLLPYLFLLRFIPYLTTPPCEKILEMCTCMHACVYYITTQYKYFISCSALVISLLSLRNQMMLHS